MQQPFFEWHQLAAQNKLPGGVARIVHGQSMTVAVWEFEAGAVLPAHAHPHEQMTFVISGSLDLRIGDKTQRLNAGDGAVIPGGVEHQATIVEAARIVDTFHPVREDLR